MRSLPLLPQIRCLLAITALSLICLGSVARAEEKPITLKTLLYDMIDRDRLATWPTAEYRCLGVSSYERKSVSPDKPGWFANHDYDQFIRVEENAGRNEAVLMDAEGPGAVIRFWNAASHKGTLRFYFDGSATPQIALPLDDIIGGTKFAGMPFSYILPPAPLVGQGGLVARNLFLPIPYASHCKITWESTEKMFYYNINYLAFPKGAKVETFTLDTPNKYAADIAKVGNVLMERRSNVKAGSQRTSAENEIAPGADAVLFSKTGGPGAIRCLHLDLTTKEFKDFAQAMRSTIVEMRFDGNKCVWCPAGAFFGTGEDIYPHSTWYTRVDESNWMECFWTMPFEKSAEIILHNLGPQTVKVKAWIDCGQWTWTARSMHFNAVWHEIAGIHKSSDQNFATIQGRGVLVGDSLSIFNNYPNWWGEGDEKIYIDGESSPSHFGTGTEDYYGYSWCRPNFFEMPWHALPYGRGNKRGGITVNDRYRLLDAIPFKTSLRFDMEALMPFLGQGQALNFTPTTFFFAAPGATVNIVPDPATAKQPVIQTQEQFQKQLEEVKRAEALKKK